MLDEVIRELTAKSNDEQMTSEGVLVWAKRVEVQRVKAAILNKAQNCANLTELKWLKNQKQPR